ncbi:hypothetical protein [Actomonas aquatica]|uniref:Tyr recombinase domain-containing protein n=1 Tax=Actomonas aquatica TaxID=2866162 RepID=A0ABZ1C3I9_9BACT|nr:hypothetical protein [Opitutus sp. WL0086]WRQ85778.1 hypothetical protein K1X11_013280 [Opitutus sp. WL0086]
MIQPFENSCHHVEDTKSVQEVSSGSRGKTHSDSWLKKVYRPKYRTEGRLQETANYSVKIQFSRRRETFPLNTANRAAAARKAKRIWASLVANGWEETLKEFKLQAIYVAPTFETVGDYLDFLEANHFYTPEALFRNVTKFFTALRSIVADEGKPKRMKKRRSKLKQANQALRAVKLSDLSPQRVESWKGRYLAERSGTPIEELRAKHTLDSYIRASKAMFGVKIRKRLANVGITLPEPVPFANTSFVSRGRSAFRYRSRIDPALLTKQAVEEFQDEKPELLKIFLLALHLGLRRNEIDKLMWSQFDFPRRILHIETTQYAQLKSEGSEDDLTLEPELAQYFESEFKRAGGIFVISCGRMPKRTGGWDAYRAQPFLTELCDWLRSKGVDAQKPIHTLRKEFGKLITEKLGLFAASLALRHSSPTVTATYYADDRREKTTGLGKLLRLG